MKEQAIQKINAIGKVSSIVALIAKILVGIGLACTIIGAIICFMIPSSLVDVTTTGTTTVNVDFSSLGISLSEEEMKAAMESVEEDEDTLSETVFEENSMKITGELEEYTFDMRDAAWMVVMAAIVLLMTFITLVFTSGLCKAFRDCESPFEENVIKKMQNFAISLIPWSVISMGTESAANSLMNNRASIVFSLNLGVILIILVVFVLVYIFKYGAVLQQESDETL